MKTILQLMVTMLAISLSLAGTLLDQIKQDPDLSQVLTNLFRKKKRNKILRTKCMANIYISTYFYKIVNKSIIHQFNRVCVGWPHPMSTQLFFFHKFCYIMLFVDSISIQKYYSVWDVSGIYMCIYIIICLHIIHILHKIIL